MTYCNNYVLAIRDQNRNILREYDGRKVFLPFHTEYSLHIKNNNNVRCLCSVKIDGTDVLGGEQLVLRPNSSTDLERFIANSNLNSGRRFRFVPANDAAVQDPTSSDNGIVEVMFHKELVINPMMYVNSRLTMRSDSVTFACCASPTISTNSFDMGATVEGSHSNQQFSTTSSFNTEAISTILRLQLIGSKNSITAHDTKKVHCTSCGKKVKFNDNYCGSCGTKV